MFQNLTENHIELQTKRNLECLTIRVVVSFPLTKILNQGQKSAHIMISYIAFLKENSINRIEDKNGGLSQEKITS